jgi:hypothetical protein
MLLILAAVLVEVAFDKPEPLRHAVIGVSTEPDCA